MKIFEKIKYKFLSLVRKREIIPSYEYKRTEIDKYREEYNLNILVETGTFFGDTVEHFKDKFDFVYSVELSAELALRARKRFKFDANVEIIEGDSGIVLEDLILQIKQPILFWLDGHYSSELFVGTEYIKTAKGKSDTPILTELNVILKSPIQHLILVDDARLFTGRNDYPTISELKKLIKNKNNKYQLSVKNDIIYILPNRESVK